ncbi:MAG TPA: phenylacetate--CoA ligase family protein [Blastocatellia bacterium]|nr:phenylacetate--CoA ligase family protein [Blastocatellia bacterium]
MSVKGAVRSILKPVFYRLPPNVCYGPQFSPALKLLEESQHWSESRLAEHQLSKLRVMLRHCAKNVPYYRRLFREVGFDPASFRELSDLGKLPLLDKETVRLNIHDLLAENIKPRDMLYFTTGGTSGTPLGVYNLRHSGGRERAFMLMQWARVGFNYAQRRAMLRGWPVKNRRHWQYDASERAYIFSNFHVTRGNVAAYARVMRDKELRFLHSYPSAVIDLARHLNDLGEEPPKFHAILASSENLYPGQREFIERFYGTRLFSWYGHTEDLILAAECEVSNCYHIMPEYGVAEVIGDDGSALEGEGRMGELIGTTLDNFAMPLIRYRTDDWAVVGPRSCACGRNYRLLRETRGRWHQEVLVGRLENLISVTALNVHTEVFDRVQQIQFYQRERGKVELRIKPRFDYSERDSRSILAALNKKIGDTMEVSLSFPDHIPLSPRGKFRLVIQDLKIPRFAPGEAGADSSPSSSESNQVPAV